MNYDFYRLLDKSKTMENASTIEALKRMYVMCECALGNGAVEKCAMSFFDSGSGLDCGGEKVSDTQYVFNCENGTIKLTLADQSTVIIEVSPTGTDEMFTTVGKVGVDTTVQDALKIGQDALNDNALMESFVTDLGRKAVDLGKKVAKKVGKAAAVGALTLSGAMATGCAGHHPTIDDSPKEYMATEYGIDMSKQLKDSDIPDLIVKISEKLRDQAGNETNNQYSVEKTAAANEATKIYEMLKNGDLKVRNWAPTKQGQETAQQSAATSFERGLDQELRTSMKVNGASFLKDASKTKKETN
jgi:hypothetical protein